MFFMDDASSAGKPGGSRLYYCQERTARARRRIHCPLRFVQRVFHYRNFGHRCSNARTK